MTSALPQTADIERPLRHVRSVQRKSASSERNRSLPGVLRAVAHPKGAQYHSGGLTPDFERGTDDNFCCSGRLCIGASGRALACADDSFGTGLRVGRAIGLGRGRGADVSGCRFCSEALAIRRAICSWLALSCSAAFLLSRAICACAALNCSATSAMSRTICSWLALSCSMLALSCSISCSAAARSLANDWSGCAWVRDGMADVGAVSSAAVWAGGAGGAGCGGAASATDA